MTALMLMSCGRNISCNEPDSYFDEFIPQQGIKAKSYAQYYGLNEHFCLLVDYSIPSGKPRVFLWSFDENRVIYQAHSMHGPGGGSTEENAVLSNVPGSNCSAPGLFAITKEHGRINPHGCFLRGLTNENRNARSRALMIHGAWWVDNAIAQNMEFIPLDDTWCAGCVTVSSREMDYLYSLIMSQDKQILLWSFKS